MTEESKSGIQCRDEFVALAAKAGQLEMYVFDAVPVEGTEGYFDVSLRGPYKDNFFTSEMKSVTDALKPYATELLSFVRARDGAHSS